MNPVVVERPGAVKLAVLPPLALYVHIPWCVRKCPYCDFNSHERSGVLPEKEYLEALFRDLVERCEEWGQLLQASVNAGDLLNLLQALSRRASPWLGIMEVDSPPVVHREAGPLDSP